MLKIILLGLGVAVVGVLLYATTRPDRFRIQRTASIAAPPAKIFPLIDTLNNHTLWSPYFRKDPAMRSIYSGPQHGVGAALEFAGNKDVGSGRLSITGHQPPDQVTMRLQMIKPFAADNVVQFTLVPRGESTDVTWAMEGRQPYFARVVSLFFDMDAMVGKDFAAGLATLKILAETPGETA